ncbi:putative transposable element, partial [Pseudoloma neurophilia]
KIEVLVDTGATQNYISKSFAKDLPEVELPGPVTIERANGSFTTASRRLRFDLTLTGDDDTKYKTEALVMDGMKNQLVLGMKFLVENNVDINLRRGLICIDGTYRKVKGAPPDSVCPDQMLVEKFKSSIAASEDEFESMIEEYKLSNPKFGHIQGYEHRIVLIDSSPVQRKAYKIQEAAKEAFKQRLKQ